MFDCSDQRTGADTKSRTALHLLLSPTRLLRALTKSTPRIDRAITLLAFSLACAAGQTAQAQTIVNICDRTDAVETKLLELISETNDCAAVTDQMLAGITGSLILSRTNFNAPPTITSLKTGDFSGLSGVTTLNLRSQGLTTLPEGVFNGLTALTTLVLFQNKLTTLPEGTFKGLTRGLTAVQMSRQNGSDNTRMLLYLGQNGNEVIATVPSGAPAELTVKLSVSGTTESGSPTSIVIPVGETSASVTLLPQSGQTLTAAFHSTPLTHTGLTLTGTTIVTAVEQVASFCGRTAAVRNAIIAHADVSATDCQSVTSAMLNGTTGVTATPGITGTFDLSSQGIASLKANDFAGLSGVINLNLSDNELTDLPAGVFNGLTKVHSLSLQENRIATIAPGVFNPMVGLNNGINLAKNALTTLPKDLFKGLTTGMRLFHMANQFDDADDGIPTQPEIDIPVFLFQDGNDLTATVPTGTPAALTVNLNVTGGATLTGSDTSITVAVGETSGTANLLPADGVTLTADFAASNTFDDGSSRISGGGYVGVKSAPSIADGQIADQQYFQQIAITPLQLPPADTSKFPPGAPPSLTYSLTATITDGGEAALENNLPAGLAFDPDTRTLSGTPSAIGTYAMTYSAAVSVGSSDSLTFTIQVDIPLDYDALHAQILSHFAITVADSAGQAVSDRIDRMASRQKPRFNTNGSDFEVPLHSQGSTFTLWLQNSATDLSLKGGDFNWSGDVSGTQFGFDWRSDDSAFLVGLMLQNLDGQFDYSGDIPGAASRTGYYSIPMDSEHVYFGWMPGGVQTGNWLNVWGMVGSGSGSLTMTGFSGEAMRSSTDMSMTHLGFSMVPLNSSDWLSLRVRGELTISSLSVDATGGVTGLDVEVTRQRVLVEPTIKDLIANDRHQLVLAGELGFRSDSTSVKGIANPNVGGLPEGVGTELGMKLGYSWRNFDVQVGFRQLSVGADSTGEQYDEDGFYFSVTMGTLFNERGWTASLHPTWGDTGSSTDRLWQATQVSDLSANSSSSGSSNGSMQAQLSYGMLSPFGASGLLIPYSQVRTSDSGATNATFGMNLNLNSGWQLHWQYANSANSHGASNRSTNTAQSANDNSGEFKLGAALDF